MFSNLLNLIAMVRFKETVIRHIEDGSYKYKRPSGSNQWSI